jgi:CRP-like cAMP-binding protein
MEWVGFGSLRRKVAESLIFLMQNFQTQDIAILRDDLVAIACVAKESLSRTLSDFKDESIIAISDNIIHIINVDKLSRMAD